MDDLDRDEVVDRLLIAGDFLSAESFVNSIEELWQKAESLGRLARAYVASGQINQAKRLWEAAIAVARVGEGSQSPQDSIDSSSVLWEIAEDMASAGELQAAVDVASEIKNTGKRQRALEELRKIRNGEKGSFYRIRSHKLPWG